MGDSATLIRASKTQAFRGKFYFGTLDYPIAYFKELVKRLGQQLIHVLKSWGSKEASCWPSKTFLRCHPKKPLEQFPIIRFTFTLGNKLGNSRPTEPHAKRPYGIIIILSLRPPFRYLS